MKLLKRIRVIKSFIIQNELGIISVINNSFDSIQQNKQLFFFSFYEKKGSFTTFQFHSMWNEKEHLPLDKRRNHISFGNDQFHSIRQNKQFFLFFFQFQRIQNLPGFRSRWMIPWECKHSIARAISSAKPIATCISKHPGLLFNIYLRNDPPVKISVTITIIGSLHAPINYLTPKKKKRKQFVTFFFILFFPKQNSKNINQNQTFARFLCWTLDHVATSLTNRASLFTISSGVSPLWTILIATFWFLYLNENWKLPICPLVI